ncbi:DEAH-box RNA helicase [Aspergillus piperis CBS 112811]|uniref:RNA helicase n=1 Tax=Aspergillus piperis CBS 112811 TaxID=1448313 RepID=A0A8G1VSX1_9EURO|nr:DEAH-box RNA helicase [Aspergillus piperis CBS 112811]RAH63395.1 DEAH-box RNA helicase [Aspergillus piperis CBS 112811]
MPKFVPRQRKQKHKQREATTAPVDTNVAELAPVSKDEKEAKRQKLKEELRAQHAQVSSKKQKRLDKYIENKLKKEENLELLKKLAQSKVDTSALQSSKELGKRKRQDEVPAVSRTADHDSRHDQDLDFSDDDSDDSLPQSKTTVNESKSEAPAQKPAENPATGIGLKRPLELGPDGFPVLKKRKKVAKKPEITITMPEVPWEGFGSDEDQDEDEESEEGEDEDSEGTSSDGSSDESGSEGESDEDEDEDDSEEDDEESEEDDDEEGEEEEKHKVGQPRQSAFKSWARQQINDAIGFKPTTVPVVEEQAFIPERKKPVRNTVAEEEPLPLELQVTTGDPNRKAFSVQVNRSEEIQNARLGLPVVGEEQKIMEAIYNNSSITTQLPQFLFEAGYGNPNSPNPGMIGVTQPRRVAAVSMAKRVGEELGEFSDQVSYQIRFESTASSKTAIKFMTDGILIREIAEDFSLSKYSVIVIDEAHERSVNTDILIGMVSRIVDLRKAMQEEDPSVKPLKLVVMSATLRISDFTQNPNLFRQGPPPLVQAQGRQYPVTIHFSRRTNRDYIEEAFRKVSRGHRKLPPGGMLVFMTGQNEIRQLSKRLKQAFKPTQRGEATQARVQISANDAPLEAEDFEIGDDESDYEITGLDEPEEDEDEFDLGEEAMSSTTRVHVLPLVFEPPPEGSRLIVLATNVAETSLTIPAKEKQYDLATGVQKFQIEWISKASANQRAGRAGRTGPGHCYRLYSSAIYENEFAEYTDPEILRTPIEGVVLQMKSMGLHNVINFPFPTPPSREGLAKAEKLLKNLGALTSEGQITQIGNRLSTYPLSPRFGKMLYVGHQHGFGDLFVPENQIDPTPAKDDSERNGVYTNADRLEDTAREQRHKDYARVHRLFSKHDDTSDALKYLSAICAYGYASDGDAFCEKMFLRAKAFKEATQLRRQLTDIVRSNNPGLVQAYQARLPEPTEKQVKAIKQIITAGFIDNVALRADLAPVPPEMHRTPKRAIDVPYFTLMRSRDGPGLELDEKVVYVHPSSVIAQLSAKEMPQYIVYSHLQQSSPSIVSADQTPKIRMYPLATPSGLQLSALAHGTPLIEYGKPIGKTELIEGIPQRRSCWVIPSLVGEAGGARWPLPAKKVIQRKDAKEGWVIEKFVA